jgi:hypothetical protein
LRFFFYGTLIDPDVRRIVLGRRAAAEAHLRDAVLQGWERRALRGVSYPVILRRAGASVDGVLASGLDAKARHRLIAYEGEGYDLVAVEVELVGDVRRAASVFAPSPGGPLKPTSGSWSYARWLRDSKRAFLREIGGGRGAWWR